MLPAGASAALVRLSSRLLAFATSPGTTGSRCTARSHQHDRTRPARAGCRASSRSGSGAAGARWPPGDPGAAAAAGGGDARPGPAARRTLLPAAQRPGRRRSGRHRGRPCERARRGRRGSASARVIGHDVAMLAMAMTDPSPLPVVGVDLGGTTVKAALVAPGFELLPAGRCRPTCEPRVLLDGIERLVENVRDGTADRRRRLRPALADRPAPRPRARLHQRPARGSGLREPRCSAGWGTDVRSTTTPTWPAWPSAASAPPTGAATSSC